MSLNDMTQFTFFLFILRFQVTLIAFDSIQVITSENKKKHISFSMILFDLYSQYIIIKYIT